jgi:hypothetical protein
MDASKPLKQRITPYQQEEGFEEYTTDDEEVEASKKAAMGDLDLLMDPSEEEEEDEGEEESEDRQSPLRSNSEELLPPLPVQPEEEQQPPVKIVPYLYSNLTTPPRVHYITLPIVAPRTEEERLAQSYVFVDKDTGDVIIHVPPPVERHKDIAR